MTRIIFIDNFLTDVALHSVFIKSCVEVCVGRLLVYVVRVFLERVFDESFASVWDEN